MELPARFHGAVQPAQPRRDCIKVLFRPAKESLVPSCFCGEGYVAGYAWLRDFCIYPSCARARDGDKQVKDNHR